jgi:hypothetical protein
MPDSFMAWVMFAYYTTGSAGGLISLAMIVASGVRQRRTQNRLREVHDGYQPIGGGGQVRQPPHRGSAGRK